MHGIVRGHFCAQESGIDRGLVAVNEVLVKPVFDVRAAVCAVEEPGPVCFVFREEQVGRAGAEEPALAILPVHEFGASSARKAGSAPRCVSQV